jgi:pyrroloquinoline quinone biosynthesis protein B
MARLAAIVLGSAAGGGFPQWNCRCPVCLLGREQTGRAFARSQASVAVSADFTSWVLLNASPDLRAQIAATSALHPRSGIRHSPIKAVVLTGAEVDQVTGLLHLRERQPFEVVATSETFDILAANPIFGVLAPDVVRRRAVSVGQAIALPGGLEAELFSVPGKPPLYLEDARGAACSEGGGNVGVEVRANGATIVFVPGAAAFTDQLIARLGVANAVFFDGTLFADDEMIRFGAGEKTGRRMGHLPIFGPGGSLEGLNRFMNRRIYIHINNTNPVLIEDSEERRQVEAAGWEVAYDGMQILL